MVRSATLPRRVDAGTLGFEEALAPLGFASRDDVDSAAARLALRIGVPATTTPGQRYYLRLSPGTVGLRVATTNGMDLADGDAGSDAAVVELRAETERVGVAEDLVLFDLDEPGRQIAEWSRRSRARMVERIAELDLSAWAAGRGVFALVTLSVPAPWTLVAPSGKALKAHVETLRKRWIEAKDETGQKLEWTCLWKQEAQLRGAPHMHLLMKIPAMVNGERFENWLAQTWADVIVSSLPTLDQMSDDDWEFDLFGYDWALGYGHERSREGYVRDGHFRRHLAHGTDVSFNGVKFDDPRRTAIYFLKHTSKTVSKEYQNRVPDEWLAAGGPGRFWGYAGLERAVAEVEISRAAFHELRRVLRHVARAGQARTALSRLRAADDRDALGVLRGLAQMRRPRRRGGFGAVGGGWVLVNDGVGLVLDVGRVVAVP